MLGINSPTSALDLTDDSLTFSDGYYTSTYLLSKV